MIVAATVAGEPVDVRDIDAREETLRGAPQVAALPRPGTSEGRQLRRWQPGPHAWAMRHAADTGDLPALRAAADRHLHWRGQPAPAVMAQLDRQLFAADPPPGFDARRWLAAFHRALRGA